MKKVCIYCSSSEPAENIRQATIAICSAFKSLDLELVWGGSDVGLIKLVADTVQASGARIHGVSLARLASQTKEHADSMYMAQTLSERVETMISMSDSFIIFPGASGTLDEFAHTLELRRLGLHQKPVILFNLDGFYDGLLAYFDEVHRHQMQTIWIDASTRKIAPISEIVQVARTTDEVLAWVR